MLELRKSADRGTGKQPWLDARFTFSFGPYQDPEHVGFSDLKLLNDDRVAPGGGFATHEHKDTEVFSYVLSGALEHKDSMGYGSVIPAGGVIAMSAGTGITHSEFNHSQTEPVHFLQMWIVPNRKGVEPRYQQKVFTESEKQGRLCLLLSPDGQGGMGIYQDARVYAGLFDRAESADLQVGPNRNVYVHVIRGRVNLNGTQLEEGDGAKLRGEQRLTLRDGESAEVLVFDLRPLDRPEV
jgi:redox-sensitive bicupin YhaK (pirin superfamily)